MKADLHAGCVLNLSLGSLSQQLLLCQGSELLLHRRLLWPDLHKDTQYTSASQPAREVLKMSSHKATL